MNKESEESALALHEHIRQARLRRGYTQEYMAEQLDVSPRTYGRWERGEVDLRWSQVLHLAEVLGCTLRWVYKTAY